MIKSMTGYGRGEANREGREFSVELKTVNHRYLDFYIRSPRQILFLEDKIRKKVNEQISRGKVDIFINYENYQDDAKSVLLDESLAKGYLKAVCKMKEDYGLEDDISVSLLTKFPDVLKVKKLEEDENELWCVLNDALEIAMKSLINMRHKEGIRLKENITEKVKNIEKELAKIRLKAPEVVKLYKEKLEMRLKELLEQNIVDEGRLATEVSLYADRCSIDEEVVRMESHILQFKETINLENESIGRKLDFIVQEMNREINTIGSKAGDLDITKSVVEVKSEIEKIREQVQNIE